MSSESIIWSYKPFNLLASSELYAILKLRSEVFVVEQNCVFLDMDDKDEASMHLMGWRNGILAAYTRIVPRGIAYPDYDSIGRVVTSPAVRGLGIGRLLMQQSIERLRNSFGDVPVKIGAQLYLKEFYGSLGFVKTGPVYDEDGIDHIPMIRPAG